MKRSKFSEAQVALILRQVAGPTRDATGPQPPVPGLETISLAQVAGKALRSGTRGSLPGPAASASPGHRPEAPRSAFRALPPDARRALQCLRSPGFRLSSPGYRLNPAPPDQSPEHPSEGRHRSGPQEDAEAAPPVECCGCTHTWRTRYRSRQARRAGRPSPRAAATRTLAVPAG